MENEILKDIIEYTTRRLNRAYGYCGVMENNEMALLNSDDRKGNGIKIKIELKPE